MQSVILRTLYNCWNQNKQMLTILVDKMLKMQIIDPAIVQAWVFCNEMKREFKRFLLKKKTTKNFFINLIFEILDLGCFKYGN